ncbi:MAG: hypothetical protein GY788_16595 [bacterium]|nr:hypothetical protein [bacterium]
MARDRSGRVALAVDTNLRNVGLVHVVVNRCCGDPLLPAAVFAFMALMVPPNLILTLYNAFWHRRHGASST